MFKYIKDFTLDLYILYEWMHYNIHPREHSFIKRKILEIFVFKKRFKSPIILIIIKIYQNYVFFAINMIKVIILILL
jgi:hypothetical protein